MTKETPKTANSVQTSCTGCNSTFESSTRGFSAVTVPEHGRWGGFLLPHETMGNVPSPRIHGMTVVKSMS